MAIFIIAAISLVGCDEALSDLDATATTAVSARTPEVNDVYASLPPIETSELMEDASEFQRGILEDGIVTLVEYERAHLGFQQCIEEKGYTFSEGPRLTALMVYDYMILYPDVSRIAEGQSAHADCRAEFTNQVSLAWTHRIFPGEAELLARADEAIDECLEGDGFQRPERPNPGATDPQNEAFIRCLFRIQEKFDIPGWSP